MAKSFGSYRVTPGYIERASGFGAEVMDSPMVSDSRSFVVGLVLDRLLQGHNQCARCYSSLLASERILKGGTGMLEITTPAPF